MPEPYLLQTVTDLVIEFEVDEPVQGDEFEARVFITHRHDHGVESDGGRAPSGTILVTGWFQRLSQAVTRSFSLRVKPVESCRMTIFGSS